MAAAMARQVRIAGEPLSRIGQVPDRRQLDADLRTVSDELDDPPEPIPVSISARGAAAVPDGQRHGATGVVQLLGQLHARLSRPDDQDTALRQARRVAVVVCMHLVDPRPERGRRGDLWGVEGARRTHDLPCPDHAPRRLDDEAPRRMVRRGDAPYLRLQSDRGVDDGGISRGSSRDLVAPHEAVRFRAVVPEVGQGRGEVRRHESELIPPVLPAPAERGSPLEDHMLPTRLPQEPTHEQAGVTGPDHDRMG